MDAAGWPRFLMERGRPIAPVHFESCIRAEITLVTSGCFPRALGPTCFLLLPAFARSEASPPSPPAGDDEGDGPSDVDRILGALDLLDRDDETESGQMSGDDVGSVGSPRGAETPPVADPSPLPLPPPPATPPADPSPLPLPAVRPADQPPSPPPAVPQPRQVDHRSIPAWGDTFYLTFSKSTAYPRGRWFARCPYHRRNASTYCTRTATIKCDDDFDRCRCH